ncbi:Inner membrane metabolite transport protein YhjE [Hartmannibacter diazotrophicus]|uniref:Inner membrane metabolite transport protein YhjE n=1 Tax=Hartmannibacter diazotrophicus TaxID=1482074 RepID=A0A2C9DCF9_9HYPH|nr:MFS transporter [Hartmannibacter diazotrophicus]SON58004.1 Inner membrane metabolite transport protein YhjE [Hartmannibacter diazotrophicus]
MTSITHGQAIPSSTQSEVDVRATLRRDHVDPGRIAIGVIIGRTSEFFNFFVFAIASVLVFPPLLFPATDPLTGTLYAFAILSLAFIARPIGSVVFMAVDRRHGRGAKLTIAMFLLGGSTAAMAFLPGYESAGAFAIVLLCVLRFLQGFALGGAWDGLASLLALNAPQDRRGWYAMIPQLGAPIGFILAAALFSYFYSRLSMADFLDWGWRYPFFVAFAINVVALFARLRLVVTEEFGSLLERDELRPARVGATVRNNGPTILLGAFVPLASYALFHVVTVFPLSWMHLFAHGDIATFLDVQMFGALLAMAGIVASGLIADRIGRRRLLGLTAVVIGLGSFCAPFLFDLGIIDENVIVIAGFLMFGLSFGQAAGALASTFERAYRYTGSALTSDLAWVVGAGFAPLVALGLCAMFGLVAVGAYLLSGALCTLAALYFHQSRLDTKEV